MGVDRTSNAFLYFFEMKKIFQADVVFLK